MTPRERATSTVRSVDPSSMTTITISPMPSMARGIVRRTSGSVSSSLRHGTWTTSFMTIPSETMSGDRSLERAPDDGVTFSATR